MTTIHDDITEFTKPGPIQWFGEEITNHVSCRRISNLNVSPFNTVSDKKYLTFMCLVCLLLDALPLVSNKMELRLSWWMMEGLTGYP